MNKLILKTMWIKPEESSADFFLRVKHNAPDIMLLPSGASVTNNDVEHFAGLVYSKLGENYKVRFIANFPRHEVEPGQTQALYADVFRVESRPLAVLDSVLIKVLMDMTEYARGYGDITLCMFSLLGEYSLVVPKHFLDMGLVLEESNGRS